MAAKRTVETVDRVLTRLMTLLMPLLLGMAVGHMTGLILGIKDDQSTTISIAELAMVIVFFVVTFVAAGLLIWAKRKPNLWERFYTDFQIVFWCLFVAMGISRVTGWLGFTSPRWKLAAFYGPALLIMIGVLAQRHSAKEEPQKQAALVSEKDA